MRVLAGGIGCNKLAMDHRELLTCNIILRNMANPGRAQELGSGAPPRSRPAACTKEYQHPLDREDIPLDWEEGQV